MDALPPAGASAAIQASNPEPVLLACADTLGIGVGTYQIASVDEVVWTKHLVDAEFSADGLLQLGLYCVRDHAATPRGDIVVFPGLNGMPRQVTGLDRPDYVDRDVGYRLARAGWSAYVVDYCPNFSGPSRSDALAALARDWARKTISLDTAIAKTIVRWIDFHGDHHGIATCLFGHSAGAYLASVTAAQLPYSSRIALASGVVPLDWLYAEPGRASPLHGDPVRPDCPASFAALLSSVPGHQVHIQYGTADTAFGFAPLRDGCAQLCAVLGTRAEAHELSMGHGTDAALVIKFLNEGNPQP